MKLTKEEFQSFNNKEKLEVIQKLHSWSDRNIILDLLLSVDIATLNSDLLGELAKVYNNTGDYKMAMSVLDMVPAEEKDAVWYYRYAYSHSELAKNANNDFESEAINTFKKLENAVKISTDDEVTRWCLDLVELSHFEEILDENKKNYPLLAEKYFDYLNKKNEKIEEVLQVATAEKKLKYKKITVEDIRNIEESFSIIDPMWWTINIYDTYEEYIKSTKGFALEQRFLMAIHWYYGEVINGGHYQFLYNSTGIAWEDVLNGFRHFGMIEFTSNFQKVVDYCGGTIPFDRTERYEILKVLQEKNEEEFFKVLDKADDFVYDFKGENELDYIKANPEKFVFEGEYFGY